MPGVAATPSSEIERSRTVKACPSARDVRIPRCEPAASTRAGAPAFTAGSRGCRSSPNSGVNSWHPGNFGSKKCSRKVLHRFREVHFLASSKETFSPFPPMKIPPLRRLRECKFVPLIQLLAILSWSLAPSLSVAAQPDDEASPAVVHCSVTTVGENGDILVVTTHDGRITAYDVNGHQLWKTRMEDWEPFAPCARGSKDGSIVVSGVINPANKRIAVCAGIV